MVNAMLESFVKCSKTTVLFSATAKSIRTLKLSAESVQILSRDLLLYPSTPNLYASKQLCQQHAGQQKATKWTKSDRSV